MNIYQTTVEVFQTRYELSLRDMAIALSDCMKDGTISYQSIKNWADGVHKPRLKKMLQVQQYATTGSWEQSFADIIVGLLEADF